MRNPFRKKPAPEPVRKVALTSVAFERWLRAKSPQPLSFFLELSLEHQEGMALIGDAYSEDMALAIGFAVKDAEAAAMGVGHDDPSSIDVEETLAVKLGAAILARGLVHPEEPQEAPQAPPAKKPLTMGGTTERQAGRDLDAKKARDTGRVLLGRRPDPIPSQNETRRCPL